MCCFCFHSIHDLQFFDEAVIVLAHDADILSLNYSQPRVSGTGTCYVLTLL